MPKYAVSMLKAWYGEQATAENEWGYQYLNKLDDKTDYSYYPMFFRMKDGGIKGLFVLGENYAVGGPGAKVERAAMRKLEWCVIRDPFLVETANFWKMDGVESQRSGYRGLFHARRLGRRERWQPDQYPAHAPVAREGDRSARRRALGDMVLRPPGAAAARTVRGQRRGARPSAAGDDLGLSARRAAARATRRIGAGGDQRLYGGRRPAGVGICRAEGRRQHRLWLLDLQRRHPGEGTQPLRQPHQRCPRRVDE